MGLTISEATDVNMLLNYLFDRTPEPPLQPPTEERALAAARHLAIKSRMKLMAGITEQDIIDAANRRREAGERLIGP